MRLAVVALSASVLGLVSACAEDAADDTCPRASAIAVEDFVFVPACIRVAKGTEVTFTNQSTHAHTIASDAGQVESFDSGSVAATAAFKHAFGVTGTIAFHCGIHPQMTGTVIVE